MESLNNEGGSTKKTILKHGLFASVLLSGTLSWFSVFYVSKISSDNAWLITSTIFSLFIIFMCLAAVLIKEEAAMEILVAITFLLSLVFTFSVWYLGILLIAMILALAGLREIRKDLDLNVKVDLWKSLYVGKFKIVLALALLISSQYFFMANSLREHRPVPKLDFSSITSKIIEPILVTMNPQLKSMQNDNISVDQFIIQSQGDGNNSLGQIVSDEMIEKQMPQNLPQEQKDALKKETLRQISDSQTQIFQKNNELILQEGRRQLSQMTGREVRGNEKIADVFAGLIDKKINDFFQPKIKDDPRSSFYSYVVATILFFTIWPLGSMLAIIWFAVAILIFKILVRLGVVEIKTVTVEKEKIA